MKMHHESNEPPKPCIDYDFDLQVFLGTDQPVNLASVYGVLAVAREVVCVAILVSRLMVVPLVQLRMGSVSFLASRIVDKSAVPKRDLPAADA